MKTLRECINDAETAGVAVGHFNISNIEGLWGVFNAARKVNVPIVIGASEGERDFIGVRQVVALIKSVREEYNYPIFLNADHTYSFERVKEAIDAGFDSVIFDAAKLSLEENIKLTKQCVDYARSVNPNVLIEGELGYIGQSSKILDAIPEGVKMEEEFLTQPEEAARYVKETGIDLLAPSVGNIHGMLRSGFNPGLNIERIRAIRDTCGVPLVLHGGSGSSNEDFTKAIQAGISLVHINTEIRIAFTQGLKRSLHDNPDEIAPYKIMKSSVQEVEKVVENKLKIFNRVEEAVHV